MSEKEKKVEINQEETKKQSLISHVVSSIKNKKEKKLQQIENEHLSEEETKRVEEKLEEANKEVVEHSKNGKKKKIWNVVFFIFNIVLVAAILIWNVYTTEDFSPLNLFDVDYLFIFLALVMLACAISMDVLSVHRMIYRKTMRSRWALSFKSVSLLRYYDAITPLSSGGQAFMVTYLTSRNVPASTSLSVPIAKLIFQQIAWLILSAVCLIISFTKGLGTLVFATSLIGFVIAVLFVSFILFLSLSKKLGKKLVSGVIKLLVKLRILKDYNKHFTKIFSIVEDYQNIMKEYSRAKFDIVYQIVLHGLRNVFIYTIPFFIYCAFMGFDGSKYGEFFMFTALIELASSFIPLPGGTGMNEITFTYLFKQYMGGATFWALIMWRFCSYYYYLLQGLGIVSYDTIYGNRKYRWIKAKRSLQEESQQFKKLQIENFRQERDKRRKKQQKTSE